MILVTVGTEKFAFDRLMSWIDNLIQQNFIDPKREEIVIQYGSCQILPTGVKSYSLLPQNEFQNLLAQARIVIAHCGEGTIDLLGEIAKPFILVPRNRNFAEHIDDHQIELARQLARQGIPIANSLEELEGFLKNPVVTKVKNIPTSYYAKASLMLEAQFDTPEVLEDLTADLIGDFLPIFA